MAAGISSGSGSFPLPEATLHAQLHPENCTHRSIPLRTREEVSDVVVDLWSKASEDLVRLNTLQVNGTTIYAPNGPSIPDDLSPDERVGVALGKMADKLNSAELAIQAAHLFQQGTSCDVMQGVLRQKGIARDNPNPDEPAIVTHVPTTMKSLRSIDYDAANDRFIVIDEQFVRLIDVDTMERMSFMKIKTFIEGTGTDLIQGIAARLKGTVVYTKEYPTQEAGLAANYLGIRAAGWKQSGSSIS